jgi:3-hydroxyacyl-CoA dehydrogenase/enoyl-CoA hydratase/carnithine racemase
VTAEYKTLSLSPEDDIAVITVAPPPLNQISDLFVQEMSDAFAQAFGNGAVRAIVLCGSGQHFIAGEDIAGILKIKDRESCIAQRMNIHSLLSRIEQGPKPVIAMINGNCSRGGLEVALACHYRVAAEGTRLGMLDLRFGLIPGMGGTQRLPRLAGVKTALQMICDAQDIPAQQALGIGLVDETAERGQLREKAMTAARNHIAGRISFRMSITGRRFDKLLNRAEKKEITDLFRDRLSHSAAAYIAPFKAVEAVERGLGINIASDLKTEAGLFWECVSSDISKNLIRLFVNVQESGNPARIRGESPRKISEIAVLGCGTMGAGIAALLLRSGFSVRVWDMNTELLEKGMKEIRSDFSRVMKKRPKEKVERQITEFLHPLTSLKECTNADMVIETVREHLEIKQKIFRYLEKICRPDTLFATNTAVLPLHRIFTGLANPSRALGLHFLNPPGRIRLLEISCSRFTADDMLATAVYFARKIGKIPLVINDVPGCFSSRMLLTLINEACFLAARGVHPFSIEKAVTEFGLPLGPFRLSDMCGIDAVYGAGRYLAAFFKETWPLCPLWQPLYQSGRLGRKSGAGCYDYRTDSSGFHPQFTEEIRKYMRENKVEPKNISPESILEDLMLRLLNEAARCLEEGIGGDAGKLDMALVYGLGFPAHRGGIFRYADAMGIPRAVERLQKQEAEKGPAFRPANLLREMAAQNRNFYE